MGREIIFNFKYILCATGFFLNLLYAETQPFLYWKSYVVKQGDTLETISVSVQKKLQTKASRNEVLRAILQHNPFVSNKDKIFPNQSLLIPSIYIKADEKQLQSEQPSSRILPATTAAVQRLSGKKWYVGLEPELSYSEIQSKDSQSSGEGSFTSALNFGFDLYLEYALSDQTKGQFIFGLDRKVYDLPSGATLRNRQENYHSLSYRHSMINNRWRPLFEAGVFENIVLSALAINEFSLDAVWQPFLKAGMGFSVLNQEKIDLMIFANASYILPGFSDRYAVEAGYELNPGIRLETRISKGGMFLSQVHYLYRYNESDISDQSFQELAWSLGYKYLF